MTHLAVVDFLLQLQHTSLYFSNIFLQSLHRSSFRFGKIKNTLFADCDLTDVDFTGAELTNVTFENCTLTSALFFQSTLASVSIKSSTIENIRITRESIKNLTVNSGQALYLATLFGLVVED